MATGDVSSVPATPSSSAFVSPESDPIKVTDYQVADPQLPTSNNLLRGPNLHLRRTPNKSSSHMSRRDSLEKLERDLRKTSSISSFSERKSPTKPRSRRKDTIENFLSKTPIILKSSLGQLRYLVLVEGLKANDQAECTYRATVWSVLLQVPPTRAEDYIRLIKLGPSPMYGKIRNDTFRTMATDTVFKQKVPEDALIRVLNSYAWKNEMREQKASLEEGIDHLQKSHRDQYVQGMNVLAAPFLYVCKSEAMAFNLLDVMLSRDCPLYVKPTLEGVHSALALIDKCLEIIDPTLYKYLNSKMLKAELYAFASVLTLSACTPPLSEVVVLWDFLFAYGVHMNVLFVIAQVNLMRDKLLESKSPMSLLRSLPPLRAQEIIKLGMSFVAKLPEDLYDLLVRHPYDEAIYEEVKTI